MNLSSKTLAAVLAGSFAATAAAEQGEEMLKVKKSTFVNLVDLLVQRGVINKQEGHGLIAAATEEAAAEAKPQRTEEARAEKAREKPAPDTTAEVAGKTAKNGQGGKGQSVYVAYVPQFVKDEIRNEVRAELRDDVVKEVKAQAKTEKWGIPAALPDWINRIHPYLDNRLRLAQEFYASDNAPYFNWPQINQDGGLAQALAKNQAYLNTTIDRLRLRERFRVGFDADITDSLKAGFRLATSNEYNPVSNNQTLGNYGESYQVAIDRVFLQYDYQDKTGNDWVTLWGGRFRNPFVSTDVVFDPDLSFEGVAGTFRLNLDRDDPIVKSYHAPEPTGRFGLNLGPQHPDSVFATFGVFPIQEVNFSSADKWLLGGQLGTDWLVHNESRLKFAASYYHYKNISARRNSLDSQQYDWTAPEFFQKGNSLVAINDTANQPTNCPRSDTFGANTCLVGLASGFKLFNVTAMFDYADFAPTHILLTADYAKNLGFDQARILREFGDNISPKTNAYQVRLDVGRAEMRRFMDWSVYFAYRYLERDAVLDAFTDSVFHQGGTDAKGWVLGAQYGLASNTWANLRWFSTDAIDGPPLSIDTLNLDLNVRF